MWDITYEISVYYNFYVIILTTVSTSAQFQEINKYSSYGLKREIWENMHLNKTLSINDKKKNIFFGNCI